MEFLTSGRWSYDLERRPDDRIGRFGYSHRKRRSVDLFVVVGGFQLGHDTTILIFVPHYRLNLKKKKIIEKFDSINFNVFKGWEITISRKGALSFTSWSMMLNSSVLSSSMPLSVSSARTVTVHSLWPSGASRSSGRIKNSSP